jgi:hypothetical protein
MGLATNRGWGFTVKAVPFSGSNPFGLVDLGFNQK